MKEQGLQASKLKLIAMGLMVLDHTYKIFRFDLLDYLLAHTTFSQEALHWGIRLIGMLGSASFWIFAFFIAEGCRRTHNRKAYAVRLFTMGLLSEIPFQYMICILSDEPFTLHFALTNVFFTLFLGAMSVMGYDFCKNRVRLQKLSFLPLLICMLTASSLQSDYSIRGVLAIFICYYGREQYRLFYLEGVILLEAAAILMQEQSITAEIVQIAALYAVYASLSLVLLSRYNGKRGSIPKWLFYWFYPLHITILVILSAATR